MKILCNFQTSVRKALTEIDPKWESYDGLIVCGTHTPHDTEQLIDEIRQARNEKRPALLICFGHQLGAIQWARDNGIPDATSEEFGAGTFVVKKRSQLKVGLQNGESWWSNYFVDIKWDIPDYFVSVAFHPEYESSKKNPHPLLIHFLNLCRK